MNVESGLLSFYLRVGTARGAVEADRNPMMTSNDLPVLAGATSTAIFMISYLPMLLKAARTKDLASYSPTQLALTNLANVVYSAYVFSLPIGPIWALHSFYVVTSVLMLTLWVRYSRAPRRPAREVARSRVLTSQRKGRAPAPRLGSVNGIGSEVSKSGRAASTSRRAVLLSAPTPGK